jgi:hypothetical protein
LFVYASLTPVKPVKFTRYIQVANVGEGEDLDCTAALEEAARTGHLDVVRRLLVDGRAVRRPFVNRESVPRCSTGFYYVLLCYVFYVDHIYTLNPLGSFISCSAIVCYVSLASLKFSNVCRPPTICSQRHDCERSSPASRTSSFNVPSHLHELFTQPHLLCSHTHTHTHTHARARAHTHNRTRPQVPTPAALLAAVGGGHENVVKTLIRDARCDPSANRNAAYVSHPNTVCNQ